MHEEIGRYGREILGRNVSAGRELKENDAGAKVYTRTDTSSGLVLVLVLGWTWLCIHSSSQAADRQAVIVQ